MRFIRLSTFAYSLATKKKLNLFLNLVIFISIFALSASLLSMYYENKIVKIDTELTILESKKIIIENEIPKVSKSTSFINNLFSKKLFNQTVLELLREIIVQDEEVTFINYRDIYHNTYYENISAAQVNFVELISSISAAKLISEDIDETQTIENFEKKINENYEKLNELSKNVDENYDKWLAYEKKFYSNYEEKKIGLIGIEYDPEMDTSNGVLILSISQGSPAENYGLKENDLILKINNKTLINISSDQITKKLSTEPNLKYNFLISRDNKKINISFVTGETTIFERDGQIPDLDKDKNFYINFIDYEKKLFDIFQEQKLFYYDFSLKFFSNKQNKVNQKIISLNNNLELLSKKEANAIMFAFIIQFIIFISAQYFEFSVGQIYEKKNKKK